MIDQQRIDEISDAAKVLAKHNRWRRGEEEQEYKPGDATKIGEAIDTLLHGVFLLIKDNADAWSNVDLIKKLLVSNDEYIAVMKEDFARERALRKKLEETFDAMAMEGVDRLTRPLTIAVTKERVDSVFGSMCRIEAADKANVELEPSAWEEHEAQKTNDSDSVLIKQPIEGT